MVKATLVILANLWCLAAWFVSGHNAGQREDALIAREFQAARSSADLISASINRQLTLTRAIPVVMALEPSLVQRLAAKFGPAVQRSPLSMAEQGKIWLADPQLGLLARMLDNIVDRLGLSSVFVMNAAGDCVADGHSAGSSGFIGANYADREYFLDAQKGLIGKQFAVGRVSNAYALFYAAPVISKNQFVGAVATRIDLEKISQSISEKEFFITDENGVIVLAKDTGLLMRAVPKAKVFEISNQDRATRYKRQQFSTVELHPAGDNNAAQLFRWKIARQPYVLATQHASDNLLTIYVLKDLEAISAIRRDRIVWFSLAVLTGLAMLLLATGAFHHYRVLLNQRKEQARLLTRMKEVNDRSTALFNATHDAVILLDGDQSIDCNPQALKMFGATSKEESLGFSPWSSIFTPPLQSDGTESEVYARRSSELALQHGTHRFEFLYKRIDTGDEFQVDIMLTAIEDNGKIILQAVLRDITERIRFEQQIQTANEQLSIRNEEQSRVIAMLSHELKTPISVIQILSGHKGVLPSVRDRISRSVADMNALIERCVLSGRLEDGDVDVNLAVCRVDQLVLNIQSESSAPERLAIRAENLPPCTTDPQLLNVILTNLVENALKYSAKETPIDIRAISAVDTGHSGLQIAVANTPGSAGAPDPELVFSKYYRARGAHGESGSGLGLYIAFGLARKLGGALRYQLNDNQVVFTLWIPV
jgi:PAS domain S-box-containing protein